MPVTLNEFIAGGIAGVSGTVVGHPLDTVKTRLQSQGKSVTRYKSGLECFMRVVKEESVPGLYKGLLSPLLGAVIFNTFSFGVEENILKYFGEASTANHYLAGAVSGLFCTSFMCPLDLSKIRLQMQGIGTRNVAQSQKHYNNSLQALVKIFQTEGLKSCYRGLGINIIRDVPSSGVYFCADYYISNKIAAYSHNNKASTTGLFLAGALAGSLSWLVIYPVDVIKTRWQADGIGGRRLYSTYLDCILQCTQKEGYGILFRGVSVCMFRSMPVNGSIFVIFKYVKETLNGSNYL